MSIHDQLAEFPAGRPLPISGARFRETRVRGMAGVGGREAVQVHANLRRPSSLLHGMERRVAGTVRSRSPERPAERGAGAAAQTTDEMAVTDQMAVADGEAGRMELPRGVRAAWRRLNVPVELLVLTVAAGATRIGASASVKIVEATAAA